MPEESTDEFLAKVTAERKPLSDQEKKKAMEVAKKVWRKATEKTKGRDSVVLELQEPDCTTIVYIVNPRHNDSKHDRALLQDFNTDL